MNKSKPFPLKGLIGVVVAVLVVEIALRAFFGFGRLPIYYASPLYEYALMPDQDMTRFGHRFFINEQGMRSAPLRTEERRILKFGDSVLNGGVRLSNDSLCSSLLEARLQLSAPERRVLNVSAGSWGPANAYAWMTQHGDFGARGIVLIFSSHDWVDTMSFRDVVGRVPFYPAEQPHTAIGDAVTWVYSRYVGDVDWQSLPKIEGVPENSGSTPGAGWREFDQYGRDNDIPLLVYHHATQRELEAGEWNPNGRALEAFLNNRGVAVVSGLKIGLDSSDFVDNIHLSASGHRKLADALFLPVKTMFDD